MRSISWGAAQTNNTSTKTVIPTAIDWQPHRCLDSTWTPTTPAHPQGQPHAQSALKSVDPHGHDPHGKSHQWHLRFVHESRAPECPLQTTASTLPIAESHPAQNWHAQSSYSPDGRYSSPATYQGLQVLDIRQPLGDPAASEGH